MSSMVGDTTSSFSASSSTSILSEKVQRALQIRTDTPAMKSALEALGQLSEGSTVPEDFALDARSVRHAIEFDALQQALLLRAELTTLCSSLHELREGISETAHIARQVKQAIHTNVIVQTSPTINETLPPSAADAAIDGVSMVATQSHQQDEERLAASLAEAFTKRNLAQERLSAVHQFLETFDLSEEDSRLLDHYNFEDLDFSMDGNPVNGTAFLKALERVKEIRQALSKTFGQTGTGSGSVGDAMELSSSRGGSSLGASSALRMMEHLAQKQEQAFERLYHWLQAHLQVFSSPQGSSKKKVSFDQEPSEDDDSDSMDQALQHPFVQASLFTLRHVPAFYRHMLELIASRRRQEETRIFLLALTSGYNGLPPLERLAHDSVSYVGDMLAFAFRSLSTEADVAMTIVHYQKGVKSSDDQEDVGGNALDGLGGETKEGDVQGGDDNYDYAEKPLSASEILSTSLSGMARPLKSRIVHVISNLASRVDGDSDGESDDGMLDELEEEGSIVRNKLTNLYEICGLLLFYISAMEKTVRKLEKADEKKGILSDETEEGNSSNALLVNITTCLEEGSKAFEATVRVYSALLGQLASSSSDSVAVMAKALIVRIAEVRQSSPGFAQDVECPVEECKTTLSTSWVATKLVEAALPECSGLDDTAALKSALSAAKKAGMEIVAAQRLDEHIEKANVTLVEKLVQTETAKVLDVCGLGKVLSAWKQWKYSYENDSSVIMAASPGLSAQEVETAMKAFYASLYSPPVPSLEGEVKDRRTRKSARMKIATNVCNTYEDLYADIMDSEKGGYDSTDFLGHTPTQVETLFSA